MIRRGVDSLCDPVSSQANYNYLQHKAAPRVSWSPARTKQRTVERGARLKLMLCQRKMVKLTPLPDKLYKLTPTICLRIDPDTENGRVLLCLMFRMLSGSQNTDFWKYILTFYHCCFATQIDNCSKTRFPTQIGLKIKFAN